MIVKDLFVNMIIFNWLIGGIVFAWELFKYFQHRHRDISILYISFLFGLYGYILYKLD